jgi:hypothetical protein
VVVSILFCHPAWGGRLPANTHDFAKFIWHQASPQWQFSDATFAKTARALDNPDHVAITISNYRWRLGLEKGEAKYAGYEQLAALPPITVPTITMEGRITARRIRLRQLPCQIYR